MNLKQNKTGCVKLVSIFCYTCINRNSSLQRVIHSQQGDRTQSVDLQIRQLYILVPIDLRYRSWYLACKLKHRQIVPVNYFVIVTLKRKLYLSMSFSVITVPTTLNWLTCGSKDENARAYWVMLHLYERRWVLIKVTVINRCSNLINYSRRYKSRYKKQDSTPKGTKNKLCKKNIFW